MDLHVAARLKRRRLRLELEPQLLDVAIGEPSGTVERVERGDKRLGASQLYKLAVVLGVGVAYFFADDLDDEDRKVSKLPKTDHKALSEAKRFARAYERITSPEIKHMIRDLLKSLVIGKQIPAIDPPSDDAAPEQPAPKKQVPKEPASDRQEPCERGPRKTASDAPARKHWQLMDMPRAERKRAP
jgi:transcriptional regulator with XRE-family HTH domain